MQAALYGFEERLAVAEGDRVQHDPHLIDESLLYETCRHGGAAEDGQILARLTLGLVCVLLKPGAARNSSPLFT